MKLIDDRKHGKYVDYQMMSSEEKMRDRLTTGNIHRFMSRKKKTFGERSCSINVQKGKILYVLIHAIWMEGGGRTSWFERIKIHDNEDIQLSRNRECFWELDRRSNFQYLQDMRLR